MDIEKIIVGTLVFCLFIIMGVYVFTDFQDTYTEKGVAVDLDIEEYTTIKDEASNSYGEVNQTIRGADTNMFGSQTDTTDTQNRLWSSAFSTLELLRTMPAIMQNILTTVATKLEINIIFVKILFLITTIGFIFAIIYTLFGIPKS